MTQINFYNLLTILIKLSIRSICQSYLNIHHFLDFLANSPPIELCFLLVPLADGCFFLLLSVNT